MPTIQDEKQELRLLFGKLATDSGVLFKSEAELTKRELLDELRKVAIDTAALGLGAAVMYAAFLVLLATAVVGLSAVMPAWAAGLLVGLVTLAGGALFLLRARKLRERSVVPERAVKRIRRDARAIQEAME